MLKRRIKKLTLIAVVLGVLGGAAAISATNPNSHSAHVYAPSAREAGLGGHY